MRGRGLLYKAEDELYMTFTIGYDRDGYEVGGDPSKGVSKFHLLKVNPTDVSQQIQKLQSNGFGRATSLEYVDSASAGDENLFVGGTSDFAGTTASSAELYLPTIYLIRTTDLELVKAYVITVS